LAASNNIFQLVETTKMLHCLYENPIVQTNFLSIYKMKYERPLKAEAFKGSDPIFHFFFVNRATDDRVFEANLVPEVVRRVNAFCAKLNFLLL